MDITAKVDYKAKGKKWSDIKAHVDRLHKNGHYSNTNINLAKSDYNYQGYLHNATKDNNDYFLPYIQFQNLRKASTGHKDEIYKSVHDYFKHRGYSNQRNSMFEIGNQNYRKKYYKILEKKGLTDKQIRKIEAKSLIDDVKEYNANSCQDVGAYAVNVDESTAHIHFQNLSYPPTDKFGKKINLMPRGKKWRRKLKNDLIKIGIKPEVANNTVHQKKFYFDKPSASFNNTWQLEFPNAKNKEGQFDSSKALHLANDKYSHMIINNFNKELAKAGVKDFRLHLIRTHNVNYRDYKQWLSSKVANDKLRKANESLQANNKSLRSNSRSITSSAVADAAPIIGNKIIENTSEAKNKANKSASTSASIAVSKANEAISSANVIWKRQKSASLSISASSSAKAKTSASMSAVAFSASSVSSARNTLIQSEANIISNCYSNTKSNGHHLTKSQYMDCAKYGATLGNLDLTGFQLANRGITSLSNKVTKQASNYDYWKSSANSIHADYNKWSDSASSISSASSFASSALSNANSIHDNTRSMMTDTLMTYDSGYKGTPKFYQFRNYANSSDTSLFSRFKYTIKNVIHKAKATIEKYVMPNKYAYGVMQDYINHHDEYYSDIKNDTDEQGNPIPNAHSLNKRDTIKLFNYDTETVHNQRERNLGRNPDIPQ